MKDEILLTVSVPTDGTRGTHYILRDRDGQERHLYDGDEDYWIIAGVIDRLFDGSKEA